MTAGIRVMGACALSLGAALARIDAQQGFTLDGLWRTDGYGYGIRVVGDSLRAFELTDVSCVPAFRAHRIAGSATGVMFQRGDAPVTLELLPGTGPDARRFHVDGAASDMILQRVGALPGICLHPVAGRDPTATFDVFWETYQENYPFFGLRRVDWRATRERYRPRVAGMSPAQLFAVLQAMIEPLHDAHTYIDGPNSAMRFSGRRPDPESIGVAGRTAAFRVISTHYLRTPLHSWANGRVSFAALSDSIGYLRLTEFSDYVPDSGYAACRRVLEAAMDTIFASTAGWRGLVIDVRVNSGGADPLGLAIAERLATAPYTAYAKVARRNPSDPTQMTAPQVSVVRPSSRPGWRGPVVELTSRYSISAAETFTQALMGRRPAIARVGESTQGVFSDILRRHLPNGWRFGLPNELFLTEQYTTFDGSGIPPTAPVPTFMPADLASERDPGLDRAIAILTGQR